MVILRKITGTPNSVYYESVQTTPGKWVSNGGYGQHFVQDTIRCGYGGCETRPAPSVSTPRYKEEQLEIAINSNKCGFMFNDNCSDEQIVNDLMNTYRHVRSLEHK